MDRVKECDNLLQEPFASLPFPPPVSQSERKTNYHPIQHRPTLKPRCTIHRCQCCEKGRALAHPKYLKASIFTRRGGGWRRRRRWMATTLTKWRTHDPIHPVPLFLLPTPSTPSPVPSNAAGATAAWKEEEDNLDSSATS